MVLRRELHALSEIATLRARWTQVRRKSKQQIKARSPAGVPGFFMSASEYRRLYRTSRWQRLRVAQLSASPLCRMCAALGHVQAATVADHIRPHRGDEVAFFDPLNLQSLCKRCHDGHKQAQERNADGLVRGIDAFGRPLDLAHPWHSPARAPSSSAVGSDGEGGCKSLLPTPGGPVGTTSAQRREMDRGGVA